MKYGFYNQVPITLPTRCYLLGFEAHENSWRLRVAIVLIGSTSLWERPPYKIANQFDEHSCFGRSQRTPWRVIFLIRISKIHKLDSGASEISMPLGNTQEVAA